MSLFLLFLIKYLIDSHFDKSLEKYSLNSYNVLGLFLEFSQTAIVSAFLRCIIHLIVFVCFLDNSNSWDVSLQNIRIWFDSKDLSLKNKKTFWFCEWGTAFESICISVWIFQMGGINDWFTGTSVLILIVIFKMFWLL